RESDEGSLPGARRPSRRPLSELGCERTRGRGEIFLSSTGGKISPTPHRRRKGKIQNHQATPGRCQASKEFAGRGWDTPIFEAGHWNSALCHDARSLRRSADSRLAVDWPQRL